MIERTKKTLPATEARKEFFKILEDVKKPSYTYTITLGGKPRAVILSADEYKSWLETIEIISDPEIVKDLKEAEGDYRKGEYVSLEEILADEGLLVRDAPKEKYVVLRQSKKKGKKKSK